MINRCIMIFPKFHNIKIINDIREKYDPLANHVAPHITLVFPFTSDITTEDLKNHLSKALSEINTFPITLKGIIPSRAVGNYLFLNIVEGNENIIEMHKRLYSGILKNVTPQWLKGIEYFPHITVGNVEDDKLFETAIAETKDLSEYFRTTVDEVSVEIIDENEDSIVEFTIKLEDKELFL